MAGEVVLPLSLMDLAKSLRELLGLTNDVANLAGRVSRNFDKRKRSKAARVLGTLGFSADGSKGVLAKIAMGQGSQADLDELKRKLVETDAQIDSAVDRLAEYEPFLEERLGLGAKFGLRSLISEAYRNDDFMGKATLRREIRALSELKYADDPQEVEALAQKLLLSIERFNKELIELYNQIRDAQA